MITAVVAGAVANTAHRGGDTWHRLHWMLGLKRLGARVHLVEQMSRAAAVDGSGAPAPLGASVNLAYFTDVVTAFGFAETATLLDDCGTSVYGLTRSAVRDLLEDADLFVNISGHLPWHTMGVRPRTAVFIDEDPGFTQIWHALGMGPRLDGYDWHFSVGANIGSSTSPVPTGGVCWRPLRPFAVLDEWPMIPPGDVSRFTTVGGWRGPFGTLSFDGTTYGVKAHEFRKFAELPRHASSRFELALDIHADDGRDREMMERHGWQLVDPRQVAATPDAFRAYVQGSSAEFSVAKGMYVQTNSGWFSDRTIRYLASGRPALVQDTGLPRGCPAGEGLMTFRTMGEAIEGIGRIERDYNAHAEAARAVAEAWFDSDAVLGRFLDDIGVVP